MPNKRFYSLLCIIIAIFLFTRLVGLGDDILNSDGARWYIRSSNFLAALKEENYAETYQHYQPGVTLMWVRAFVEDTSGSLRSFLNRPQWYLENYGYFPHIHKVTKSVLVILLSVVLLYQIILIRNLFGQKIALFFGALVAFEPYLVGIDRWFHLTSLETYFSFSAFLTVLYWSRFTGSKPSKFLLLILSGVMLAFSVLSKITGIICLVPVFVIFILEFTKLWGRGSKFKYLVNPLIFFISFCFTIFVSFPALWHNSAYVLSRIFDEMLGAVGTPHAKSLLTTAESFLFYSKVLLYKLSPVTLVLFVAAIVAMFKRKKCSLSSDEFKIFIYLLTYYVVLSFSSKKFDRYSLEFFPPILLMISLYLGGLRRKSFYIVGMGIAIVSTYVSLNNYPVISGYYSPVAGGERTALVTGIYDNSGEYLAQAAFYLNKYDAKKVFIDNNFETFKFFSKHQVEGIWGEIDYALYSLDSDRTDPPFYYCGEVEKAFGPRFEKPVVYVYKCDKAK